MLKVKKKMFQSENVNAVLRKVPSFFSEDCEEPLMFILNEEDEEDDSSRSDSGKYFKLYFLCRTGLRCVFLF